MGLILVFSKYYIIFFLIVFSIALTGHTLYSLLPVKKDISNRFLSLFLSLLIGVVFLITIFSVIATGFKTVNLLFLLLGGFLIYINYDRNAIRTKSFIKDTICFIKQNILILFILCIPFYAYEAIWFLRDGSFNFVIPFVDYVDMYNISQVITLTGQENNKYLLSNFYYPQFKGISPYHFFELWFNGSLSYILKLPGALTLMLFVYPFFYFTAYIGILAFWENYGIINIYKILISFLLLFTGGMFFSFYENYELLKWYGGSVGNIAHIWGKKMSVLYPFIIAAYLCFIKNKYICAIILFLSACIAAIGIMPGIVAGIFLFIVSNKIHKTLSKNDIKLSLIVFFTFFITLLIVFFAFGNKNQDSLGFTTIVADFFKAFNPSNMKVIFDRFVYPVLRLTVIFSPFLIFVLYVFLKYKRGIKEIIVLLFFIVLTMISGALVGAYASINIFSGIQFFAYTFCMLIIYIMLCFVIEYSKNNIWPLTSKSVLPFAFILFFVFSTSYNIHNNIKLQKHYKNKSEKLYSYTYLEQITNFLNNNNINPLGVCFMGKQDIAEYPLNAYGITGLTFSGMSIKLTNDFHAVSNLSIFDLSFNPTGGFPLQLFKSFEFYNFVEAQKNKLEFTSIKQSQLDFIKQNSIQYVLVYKNAEIPEGLLSRIKLKFTDEKSGQRFVVLN